MTGIMAVIRHELVIYFTSPIGYIAIAIFWIISGYFFSFNVFFVHAAHMVTSFHNMSLLLMLVIPLITMRTIAEEVKMGTMELLLTLPLTETEIVLGKFIAAVMVLLAMLVGTSVSIIPLVIFSEPDLGPIFGGYIGVFTIGVAFIGIGFFASSVSSNQITAAIISWASIILLWFLDYGATITNSHVLVEVFQYLSFSIHYMDLIRGILSNTSLAYLFGLTVILLTATIQSLKYKRLR